MLVETKRRKKADKKYSAKKECKQQKQKKKLTSIRYKSQGVINS